VSCPHSRLLSDLLVTSVRTRTAQKCALHPGIHVSTLRHHNFNLAASLCAKRARRTWRLGFFMFLSCWLRNHQPLSSHRKQVNVPENICKKHSRSGKTKIEMSMMCLLLPKHLIISASSPLPTWMAILSTNSSTRRTTMTLPNNNSASSSHSSKDQQPPLRSSRVRIARPSPLLPPHQYYPTPARVGLLIRVGQHLRNNEKGGLALAAMEAALDLLEESEDHFGASSGGEEDP
jgi:hypothetical protein